MNFTDLRPYINRLDMIQATAEQIIKDFDMFGMDVKFSGNPYNAYEELFNQIEPHIRHMLDTNPSKFMGFLYRIDLSDELLKKSLKENSSESLSQVISDLVIKRELQKVVIRQHFKK